MNVCAPEVSFQPAFKPARAEKPTLRIRPTKGWAAINLRELWQYRGLIWILVERDLRLLYKQTALGWIWIVLQPLIAALIFTVIFGAVARLPSDGTPYVVFVMCGMTVWTYFSSALQRAGNSVVHNSQLVSKVYFPRLIIPLVHVLRALIDFGVTLIVLFILALIYRITPTFRLFAIPGFLILMVLTATGIALWFAALSVRYRDCHYALPYFLQIWMYASPVVYPMSIVPKEWHWVFALNPAVGFIEGFRWAVLGKSALDAETVWISIIIAFVALLSGAFFFRRAERDFADVI